MSKHRYRFALKRAKRKNAVPKWADRDKIYKVYENCPKGMHVDHIIPLRGELVSGLHVAENLQYLPFDVGNKKDNFFDPLQFNSIELE